MTAHSGYRGYRCSAEGATAAGLDHVLLSYGLLERGDADGFASLFEPDAVLAQPGLPLVRGRSAVQRTAEPLTATRIGTHALRRVFAADHQVAVTGRFTGEMYDSHLDVAFSDIFTISERGLVRSRITYFFAKP